MPCRMQQMPGRVLGRHGQLVLLEHTRFASQRGHIYITQPIYASKTEFGRIFP